MNPTTMGARPLSDSRLPRRFRAGLLLAALTTWAAMGAARETAAPLDEPPPAPATGIELGEPAQSRTGIRAETAALETALAERRRAVAELRRRLDELNKRLTSLTSEYEGLRQRLGIAGLDLSGEFASLLRRRLDRLQSQHFDADLLASVQSQIEAARIEQFRLEELAASLPRTADGGDRRAALVAALGDTVDEHIRLLNDYFQASRAMRQRIGDYQALLRERLFWLPSAPTADRDTAMNVLRSWGWLAHPGQWRTTAAALPDAIRANAGPLLLLSLLLAGLLASRGWFRRRLADSAADIGRVERDRFTATLAALGCTVVLSLPGPVALILAERALADAGGFGRALGAGLGDAAFVFLLLSFLFNLARGNGLAARHFRWSERVLRAIRLDAPSLLLILAPAAVLTALTEAPAGDQYRDSLGRATFAVASIALAWFAHAILRAVEREAGDRAVLWLRGLRAAAVALPVALTAFALYGYHYTAVQLETTLFLTACWLVAVIILHHLALRALAIRERRLALARLREQRETERAMSASREAAESAGEGMPATVDEPGMDLRSINTQTHTLLRLIVGVVAAAGLLALWSDVIPALGILEGVTLWRVAPVIEGAEPMAVSLQDLLLALAVAALTVLAARNLPGMLEVALLSRLRLGPGGSYAATTLGTYVIVIVGVIVVLGLIGAQWSKLQWLVAALGVGLGFGLQEIVANFVSGIILLFERPIRVGDTVTVGDKTGTVTRIRIRATTLTDWDRKEQIVPNKTFVTQELTNWTLSDAITRVIIRVGVAYASDIDQVHRILTEVVERNTKIASDPPPAVFCVNFGDSSIDFEVRVFVRRMLDIMPLSHEIRSDIARAFREYGIEIPFPQRDIHVRTMVGEVTPMTGDGDNAG